MSAGIESLREAGRRLAADRKKNDHCTADPIFTVQREARLYGLSEGFADGFVWTENGELCGDDLSARLERRYSRGWPLPDRFDRVGYVTRWDFVDAYLSPQAAKDRVEYENRRFAGSHRVFVESGCRNHEWKAIRAHLLELALAEEELKS